MLTQASLPLTFGESAAYFVMFGNKTSGVANRAWVEYFFGELFTVSTTMALYLRGRVVTYKLLWNRERAIPRRAWME